jgi:tRNA G18 (ribose-2'-O)-methylase SpoU
MDNLKTFEITSQRNGTFAAFKEILSSRGISKHHQAIISGRKAVLQIMAEHPGRCIGLITGFEMPDQPEIEAAQKNTGRELTLYRLHAELFRDLDVFGTKTPLLLVSTPPVAEWATGKSPGCELVIAFQDPSNVGAVIRSAVAFGVKRIILGPGCAHPFHPKSTRAASGTVFIADYFKIKSYEDLATPSAPVIALDMHGEELSNFHFPDHFILVPGVEGPGVPANLHATRVTIQINSKVESLNAMAATSIALHQWSVQIRSQFATRH